MNRASVQFAAIPELPDPEIDTALLSSVARQLMHRRQVAVEGQRLPIGRTSRQYFRMVKFPMLGRQYVAIEQNVSKPSYWGQLARKGHEVVQFKDNATGRFVAVAVDGAVRQYRATRSRHAKRLRNSATVS